MRIQQLTKTIKVDESLDSYNGFFDHDWVRALYSSVQHSRLEEPLFELTSQWKGISNARRLPWLMMHGLKDSIDSALNSHTPFPLRVLQELLERLGTGTSHHHFSLTSQDRQTLILEIRDIESQLIGALKSKPYSGDLNMIWRTYVESPEVRLALWMSEINAYAGVYFAYEHFLVSTMRMLSNLETLRVEHLADAISKRLGKPVLDKCWKDAQVDLARRIRNALVHNGRKPTKGLQGFKDRIAVQDGQIVLTAHQTTALFNILKVKVSLFCDNVLSLDRNARTQS